MTRHADLTQYMADERDDSDAKLECYFEEYTGSLWHVYAGEMEIYNLLSDAVIQDLEREFNKHMRKEAQEHALDLAIDRYESRQLDAIMNRQQWQPAFDSLTVRA